jgi:hypothetical protein
MKNLCHVTGIMITLGILASTAVAQDRQAEHLNAGIKAVFAKNPYLYEGGSCVAIPKPTLNQTWIVAVGESITAESGLSAKRNARSAASVIANRLIGELLDGQTLSGVTYLSESEVTKNDEATFESFFESTTKSQMKSFLTGVEDMGNWEIEDGGERGFYRVRGIKLPMSGGSASLSEPSPSAPNPAPAPKAAGGSSPAASDSPTVNSDGVIVVVVVGVAEYMGNVNYSRQEAVKAATMEALKKALGVAIQGEKVVKDGELVLDQVYEAMPQGSLKDYDLLEEDHTDSEYRVTIRARVSRDAIVDTAQNIGMLMSQVGKPKVAVIHMEKLDGELLPYEDSVVRMVIDDLYSQPPHYIRTINVHQRMITRKTQAPEQWEAYEEILKTLDQGLDARAWASCGVDADILVKGLVELDFKGTDSDGVFKQYQANLTVEIVMAATGRNLGSLVIPGITANADSPKAARLQAINKTKPRLEPLIEKTIRQLQDMAKNGMEIEVTLQTPPGIKKRAANRHGRKVRDMIQALPKVKEVQYGKEGAAQNYAITFLGTPSEFGELFEEFYEDEFGDWLDEEELDYGLQLRGGSISLTLTRDE